MPRDSKGRFTTSKRRKNPDFFTRNGVVIPLRKDTHGRRGHKSPAEKAAYRKERAKGG